MNDFTDYLEKLIEEKGTNPYKISKISGLNKTSLQRLLKGERLPKEDFMEKLYDYLCVSPAQRYEVRRLYQIQKIGINTYKNRIYIKNMLENNINIDEGSNGINIAKNNINVGYLKNVSLLVVKKNYEMIPILRDIIEYEIHYYDNPSIQATVPFDFTYLIDLIMSCQKTTNKKMNVEHIIKFNKNTKMLKDANFNLKILSSILPFALSASTDYIPYYYYGNTEKVLINENPMPYYILTTDFLVQISDDFEKLIIFNDDTIYNLYEYYFLEHKKQCNKLLTAFANSYELMNYHNEKCTSLKRTASLKSQPSFGIYFTNKFIEEKLRDNLPNRELYLSKAKAFYQGIIDEKEQIKNFFTKEGLDEFIKYGIFSDIPKIYMDDESVNTFINEITKEDKLFFLNSIYKDIDNNLLYSRVINTSKFSPTKRISIAFYENEYIVFFYNSKDGNITGCYINEQELLSVFSDFFDSLDDNEYIYSKEDTLAIIQNTIDNLSEEDE